MMHPSLASFGAGAIGLIVFFLLNLLVLRWRIALAPVTRQVLLALVIHVLTTLGAVWLLAGVTYWHGAALYWLGFNCILYAYSAVYKSVSLRTLRTLAQTRNQSLALKVLVEQHVQPCFTERTRLLVTSGLAQESMGTFAITEKGRQLAARLTWLQHLFGIQCSGLYISSH